MKKTVLLTLGALTLGSLAVSATTAAAQTVEVGGEAEPMCALPASWSHVSSASNAAGSVNFVGGNTWAIPAAHFASPSGVAGTVADYAIRVRGTGSCNTSHDIKVTSQRGGLAHESDAAAPDGFARRRAMKYEAYWSTGSGAYGPAINFTPSTPGQTATVRYTVGATRPPPGNRSFDIRMALLPGAVGPLVSGAYSDILTITLSPVS